VRYCNVIPCPLGINGETQLPWVQVCVFVKNRAYSIISGLRIYHYGDDPDKFYDKMVSDGGHEIDRTVISRRQEGDYVITTYRFNRWVYSDRIYLVWWNESRNVNCKIAEIELLKPPLVPTVTADFWYRKHLQKPQNIERLYDGLWTTQVQTISYSKPLKSFLYAVFEFKNYIDKNNKEYSGQPIDAIDITGGWYIPSGAVGARKYETKARYTIKYNTDGSNIYFPISAETTNFELSSGETKSFEREVLGEDFVAKRLALYVEDIEPIEDLGLTKWVISLVEFACYRNIYLVGETKLIPTTKLTQATNYGDTTIYVKDTGAFPSAGTAYLDDTLFTYTGKTATSFTGCSGIVEKSVNTRVSQYLEEKTNPLHPRYGWIYDPDHLLVKVGDRVYKDTEINKYLNTEQIIKDYSKMFLRELSNNISKANVTVVARPDAVIGDSVLVSDTVNLGEDKIYFVEGIDTSTEGGTNFKLSRYADYVYL
jgi:predicted ThiF/HesA family dinucleotide-utilizing enzyme